VNIVSSVPVVVASRKRARCASLHADTTFIFELE
jgi:hypothetical protein